MPIITRTCSKIVAVAWALLAFCLPLQRVLLWVAKHTRDPETAMQPMELPHAAETIDRDVTNAIRTQQTTLITPQALPPGQQLFDSAPAQRADATSALISGTPLVLLAALRARQRRRYRRRVRANRASGRRWRA